MAIKINPDGTVSTIETIHDQYGNLRPKITNPDAGDHYSWTPSNHGYTKLKTPKPPRKKKVMPMNGRTNHITVTFKDIDAFFDRKILERSTITVAEYDKLYRFVPDSHKGYLKKKYDEYLEYRRLGKKSAKKRRDELAEKVQAAEKAAENSRKKTEKAAKIAAKQERKAEKAARKKAEAQRVRPTGNTIGDIATISSLRAAVTNSGDNSERKEFLKHLPAPVMERAKAQLLQKKKKPGQAPNTHAWSTQYEDDYPKAQYASSQDFDVRTSRPPRPSRPPKYAYARDRYGRVQERDSFNEEKRNEFYQAQNMQRNYDYSSYDANDDHDGAYSGWE